MNREEIERILRNKKISSCFELEKEMRGRRDGIILFNQYFREDFQTKMYALGYLERENRQFESEIKQLQNNWNELKEDITHILEMIDHNKDIIKVTSDEELAIYSLQNKIQELEGKSGKWK